MLETYFNNKDFRSKTPLMRKTSSTGFRTTRNETFARTSQSFFKLNKSNSNLKSQTDLGINYYKQRNYSIEENLQSAIEYYIRVLKTETRKKIMMCEEYQRCSHEIRERKAALDELKKITTLET